MGHLDGGDWTRHFDKQLSGPRGLSILDAFRKVDWSKTSLGATDTWSQSLRTHVRHIFQLATPAALYIGEDSVMIYNPASLDLYKERHPFMMGKPIRVAFSDLEDKAILDLIKHHLDTGTTGHVPASHLKLNRVHGPRDLDEDEGHADLSDAVHAVVVTWDVIPLTNDDGSCFGITLPWTDVTELFFARATEQFVRKLDLFSVCNSGGSLPEAYALMSDAFESEPLLFPMALLFARVRTKDDSLAFRCCVNIGTTFDTDSIVVPAKPSSQCSQLQHFLLEACSSGCAQEFTGPVEVCANRALGERSRHILVHPIHGTDTGAVDWVLVLSANPLRALDQSHRDTLRSTCETVSAGLKYLSQQLALSISEKRFLDVVRFLPVGVLISNRRTGSVNFANPEWRAMYNIPEYMDTNHPELFNTACQAIHPDSQFMVDRYHAIDDESKHFSGEDIRMNEPAAGQSRQNPEDQVWYKVSTSNIGDNEIAIVSTDVSVYHNSLRQVLAGAKFKVDRDVERHRADLAEQQTTKHLEFIDYFSHELRNPLGAIFHCVEMGLEQLDATTSTSKLGVSDELNDSLRTINLCAKHMQRIMDDTLLFSQLQSGKLSICMVPTDVPTLVDTVLGMFRSECQSRGITLQSDISNWRLPGGMLLVDPNRLTQILINLIANSIKFTSKSGRGIIRVRLSSSETNTSDHVNLSLSIVDNGLPMKDEEIAKLFQRFQQANKKTHVDYGGSGLGLYICHALMKLLNGSIEASRNDIGGTTFAVHFSAAKSPDVPRPSATGLTALHTDKSSIENLEIRLPKINTLPSTERAHVVLLVEDNLVNQRLIEKQLKRSGYRVLVANNGKEALDIFTSPAGPSIDICLCDIEMPVMDGYKTVEQVRVYQAEQKLSPTPFIAISANARPEQLQRQLDSGMTSTLAKPFTFAALVVELESTFAKATIRG